MLQDFLAQTHQERLSIVDFGEEKCIPSHEYGPAARAYYLMHYVASGHGELIAGGKIYPVETGQAFLIYPGELTTYRADSRDPWHYAWVGYTGREAEEMSRLCGFGRERRVIASPQPELAWNALRQLRQDAASLRLGHVAALGGLYRFLSLLAPERDEHAAPEHERYYEKAMWYMQGAYARHITVQEIADFVGLSRSQLFRVFEKNCGQSPKQAMQQMRLEHGRLLLKNSDLSVEQVALSVGFSSSAQFSAAFRERFSLSPREYRQRR